MSEQNVLAFINKANSDPGLASKVKALPTANLTSLLSLAQGEGFPFTEDQWHAVTATAFGGELEDDALDNVVGGADGGNPVQPTIGNALIDCNGMLPTSLNQSLFKSFGK